jgi:hypothetical protein
LLEINRATGREGKLCADTCSHRLGANRQKISRPNGKLSADGIDKEVMPKGIFIDEDN